MESLKDSLSRSFDLFSFFRLVFTWWRKDHAGNSLLVLSDKHRLYLHLGLKKKGIQAEGLPAWKWLHFYSLRDSRWTFFSSKLGCWLPIVASNCLFLLTRHSQGLCFKALLLWVGFRVFQQFEQCNLVNFLASGPSWLCSFSQDQSNKMDSSFLYFMFI